MNAVLQTGGGGVEAVAGRWRHRGMVAARQASQWVVRGLRRRALYLRSVCLATSVVCSGGAARSERCLTQATFFNTLRKLTAKEIILNYKKINITPVMTVW